MSQKVDHQLMAIINFVKT